MRRQQDKLKKNKPTLEPLKTQDCKQRFIQESNWLKQGQWSV